ncbi:MAG: prolipoprotein diacylglyceryl transferase [Candidatus Omnitrophica bacterium]|nr:prolipoprotein diacylglyceryl transferase [Candidatus Omnitrophota bacterium]MDD5593044.1 prolipoprotein diacylglyceryl transferase [Candidatus Omnitrophota bacterium]
MHPIICKIGPLSIYSYGLMLVLALLTGSSLASLRAKKEGIDPDIIFNFSFIVFIWGIIGARLFYIIENAGYYLKNPLEIIMLQRGGLSWFGGLILSIFCAALYLKKKRLAAYKVLDCIVPFVALGQAIGRIGCLLNGCCFGKISKFGIYFKEYDSILIPTQIYSAFILVLIFITLRFLQDKPHKEGKIFFSYLLLYSTKRFFIEFWRADNEIIFLGLTLFQLISIGVFCLAVWKLLLIKRVKK